MGGKNKGKKDKAEKQASRRKQGKAAERTAAEQEAADAETAAQVREIEERLQAVTAEMRTVETSIRACTLEAKRAELMGRELAPLPADTKAYRQVGKMFLLQGKDALATSLKATAALKVLEGQQLQQARGKLEAKMKSEATALREILGPEKMRELFAASGGFGASSGPTANPAGATAPGSMAAAAPEDGPVPLWGAARGRAAGAGAGTSAGTPSGGEAPEAASDGKGSPAAAAVEDRAGGGTASEAK
mmetsp:Transcript_79267/g.256624  ORF Transcript_79267/g.256624 Transcript_79267/m.256624 type:complete len:247 (-) Transcript_79267:234-974(-)